jgi:hypothetical protein
MLVRYGDAIFEAMAYPQLAQQGALERLSLIIHKLIMSRHDGEYSSK